MALHKVTPGVVQITIRVDVGSFLVQVVDNGHGMSFQDLSQVTLAPSSLSPLALSRVCVCS